MTVERTFEQDTRSTRVLRRIGGSFLTLAIFAVEMISLPIAALSLGAMQANSHMTPEQLGATALWGLVLICLADIALLISISTLTGEARQRLDRWTQGKSLPGGKAEYDAWNQVTSIWWRYGAAVVVVYLVLLLVLAFIQSSLLGLNADQVGYTFLGGTAGALAIVLITTPILDSILHPTLLVLRPEELPEDERRFSTAGLEPKFQSIIIAAIALGVLLLAPAGYQAVNLALNRTVDSGQLLQDVRLNLIGTSLATLIVGSLVALLLSRQIFVPIYQITKMFERVQKGDLKQRADIAYFTSFPEMSRMAASFNEMTLQLEAFQQTLEKRITDSNELLRATNDVGKIASTILDPDTLVTQSVNLIANTFSYYFVAIFLVVDERRAALKDATGTAGEVLKENHHTVPISDNNMVGASIIKKEPQIALDVGEGAKIVYNPLLSFTRSELTLPLIVGERVIGALDVQSTREADFNTDNIATLQGMANQVAIAIENARLFAQMDQTLEELRQANKQYVVSSWTDKLQGQSMEFSTNSSNTATGDDTHEVVVGLNLRDQSIGQIRLQTDEEWTPEDQTWVESLATQVAISLENARLIEESQGSALRERLSASIVQKIWASTTSIDTILKTAVRELGRALEASETTIELQVEEKSK